MRRIRYVSLFLAIVMIVGGMVACGNVVETGAPETYLPETNAPDTEAPETNAPETEAPETDVTETEDPAVGDAVKSTFKAVADTYVQLNSSDDFGAAEKLMVKMADAKGLTRHAFVRFDLSGLEISTVEKVTLRLYCVYANDTKSEIQARDYKLYAITSDWEEMGMTWATQPEAGEKVTDIDTTSAAKDKWIEIDITEYVKSTFTKYISFMICNEGPDSENNHINMGSREVAGQEPQIVIEGKLEEGKALTLVDNSAPAKEDEPVVEESEPVATLIAAADTYVQTNSTEDFGAAEKLMVKNAETKNLSRRTFLRFDLSNLKISKIDKVTIRLYCLFASLTKSEIANRDYKLYAVTSDWNEMGMTWGTQPTAGEKVTDIDTTTAKKGEWIEIDVTEYVKKNLYQELSFVICNEGPESEENHINFASREVSGQEPQLVFEGKYEAGKELAIIDPSAPEQPENVTPDECAHTITLFYQLPTATAPGYILRQCMLCGYIDTYTILSADATIPTVVDKTFYAKADAYVQAGSKANTTFGDATELFVKMDGNNSRVSFLTFDMVYASADEIDSAILRLMVTYSGEWSKDTKDQDYKLYAVDPSSWKESEVTWNKMLELESSFAFVTDVETIDSAGKRLYKPGDWIEIDVTDYVKEYVAKNPGKAISFVLRDEGVANANGHIKFASRETENAPELFVEGTFDPDAIAPEEPTPEAPAQVEVTVTAKADTHVQAGSKADVNFAEVDLFVKKDGNNSRVSFLTFDMVNATEEQIDSVVLRLMVTYSGDLSKYTKDQDYKLYTVDPDAWAELELTWNKMLELESSFVYVADVETINDSGKRLYKPGDWIEIDLTEYVKAYVAANPGKDISFVLRDEGGDNSNGHLKFASRESENAPQLIIKGTFAS